MPQDIGVVSFGMAAVWGTLFGLGKRIDRLEKTQNENENQK
jgi:hypothetical protein